MVAEKLLSDSTVVPWLPQAPPKSHVQTKITMDTSTRRTQLGSRRMTQFGNASQWNQSPAVQNKTVMKPNVDFSDISYVEVLPTHTELSRRILMSNIMVRNPCVRDVHVQNR